MKTQSAVLSPKPSSSCLKRLLLLYNKPETLKPLTKDI